MILGPMREAVDFDVLKAVKRKPRLPDLDTAAATDVSIDAACLAQVGGVDRAVGIEALGKAQGDLLACPAGHL